MEDQQNPAGAGNGDGVTTPNDTPPNLQHADTPGLTAPAAPRVKVIGIESLPPELQEFFQGIGDQLSAQFATLDKHKASAHDNDAPDLFTVHVRPCGCATVVGPENSVPDLQLVADRLRSFVQFMYDAKHAVRPDHLVEIDLRVTDLALQLTRGGEIGVHSHRVTPVLARALIADALAAMCHHGMDEVAGAGFAQAPDTIADETPACPNHGPDDMCPDCAGGGMPGDRLTEEDLAGGPNHEPG